MIQLFNDQKFNLIGVMSQIDSHSKNKPTFILSKLKLFKTLINVNGSPVFQSAESKDALVFDLSSGPFRPAAHRSRLVQVSFLACLAVTIKMKTDQVLEKRIWNRMNGAGYICEVRAEFI